MSNRVDWPPEVRCCRGVTRVASRQAVTAMPGGEAQEVDVCLVGQRQRQEADQEPGDVVTALGHQAGAVEVCATRSTPIGRTGLPRDGAGRPS